MQEQIARSPKAALALVLLVGSLFLVQIGALISNVLARGPVFGEMGIVADTESDKVGATAAEFRVDESGAATYSIPLYSVPGTAGVAPKLSLNYSSQGGYGPLGKGWTIGGPSGITRCRATREAGDFIVNGQPVDAQPLPINYSGSDRFCLDGQRLVPATQPTGCPAVGGTVIEWRTEIESFQRVCSYSNQFGPAFFTVQRKDGSISWYGDRDNHQTPNRPDGYVNSTTSGKESFALSWAQTRFQDSTGNYIDYVYAESPAGNAGEHLITEVRFTGKAVLPGQTGTSHAPYAKLKFEYDLRPQASFGYVSGGMVMQRHRLARIYSCDIGVEGPCAADRQARYYQLTYQTSQSNSGLDTLTSLQECRDNSLAVCMAPTTFQWTDAKYEFATLDRPANLPFDLTFFVNYKFGDIDGDGRQDLVHLSRSSGICEGDWIVTSLARFDAQNAPTYTNDSFLCLSATIRDRGEGGWQLFDYNGDGLDDLFVSSHNNAGWRLHPSNGTTFDTNQDLIAGIHIPSYANPDDQVQLADINGDGQIDIVYPGAGLRARISQRQQDGTFAWGDERIIAIDESALPMMGGCVQPDGYYVRNCQRWIGNAPSGKIGSLADFNGDSGSDLLIRVTMSAEYRRPPSPSDPFCNQDIPVTPRTTHIATGMDDLPYRNHANGKSKIEQSLDDPCYETQTADLLYAFVVSELHPDRIATTNYGIVSSSGYPNAVSYGDANGDGLTDLYIQGRSNESWAYLINSGVGFQPAQVVTASGGAYRNKSQFADANGDGRTDFLHLENHDGNKVYFASYAQPDGSYGPSTLLPGGNARLCDGGCNPDEYVPSFNDLDGDGQLDFMSVRAHQAASVIVSRGAQVHSPRDVITRIINGMGAETDLSYAALTNADIYRRAIGTRNQVNWGRGSPVTDLLASIYVVARASSSSPQPGNPAAKASVHYRYGGGRVQAGGRGFLGFDEIVTFDPNQTGGYVASQTAYRQDFPFIGVPKQTIKRAVVGGTYQIPSCLSGALGNHCFTTPGNTFPVVPGSVFSDSGQIWEADTDSAGTGTAAFAPSVQAPIQVRTSGTLEMLHDPYHGGVTSKVATGFIYGAQGNVTGTGVDTYTGNVGSPMSTVITDNQYAQDNPALWRLGRLTRSTVTHRRPGQPDVVRVSAFDYAMAGPATGLLTTEIVQPEGGLQQTLRKVYSHDEYGNRTSVTTCSSDFAIGNCLPANIAFQPSNPFTVHRYARTQYDAIGRYPVYTYEPFWNGSGASERITQTVYSRNIFGDAVLVGNVNSVVSYAAPGAFGRAHYGWAQAIEGGSYTNPGHGVESWTIYRWCTQLGTSACPEGAVFRQEVLAEGAPTQWTYFDALGRAIVKAAESFNAGVVNQDVAASCTLYDLTGKPTHVSNPFFLNGTGPNQLQGVCALNNPSRAWTVTQYDVLGRPTRATAPDSSYVTTAYQGLETTVTDQRRGLSQTTRQLRNGKGEVVQTTDAVGMVLTNQYLADGGVEAILRNAGRGQIGNGFAYDALGRKILQNDPDAGQSTYQYNALGELIVEQRSADASRIEHDYDARGRIWRKTVRTGAGVVDSQSAFTYDTQFFGLGQLAGEAITGLYQGWTGATHLRLNFRRGHTYDSLGRHSYSETVIDNGSAYPARTHYDALGRAYKAQDASSRWSKSEFNARGFPSAICFSSEADVGTSCLGNDWQRTRAMDAWGNVTQEIRSATGQLPVTREYNPLTGRLERICADKPGGGACEIVHEAYGWDSAGNLRTQQKEGRYLETFEIDTLNRVSHGYTSGTLSYWAAFDALGNVCAKSQGSANGGQGYSYVGPAGCGLHDAANSQHGTAYGTAGASPHQVVTAGGASYGYDLRGNQLLKDAPGTANDRSIAYSIDDKAYAIVRAGGAQVVRFWYGPDGQRYKRQDVGQRVTHYLGNVEVVIEGGITTYKRYIGGMFLQTVTGGAVSNQYLFHDQLGSVVRITDNLGNTVANMDFVPSGERRNFGDPKQYNGAAPSQTTRGFTGHEMVDGLSVIHMNGRIYDPDLGRFLQADPVIQAPGDLQSWNAYTYVFNNPLVYTDPSGMISLPKPLGLLIHDQHKGAIRSVMRAMGPTATGVSIAIGCSFAGPFASVCTGVATYDMARAFGASSSEARKAGAIAAGTAAAFQAVGGYFEGAGWAQGSAADPAVFGTSLNAAGFAAKVVAHGMVGGISTQLQGGEFGHGFASAGITQAFSGWIDTIDSSNPGISPARIAAAAIVGGTAAELSGGKFANGAVTAAFSRAFNDERARQNQLSARQAAAVAELAQKKGLEIAKMSPEEFVRAFPEMEGRDLAAIYEAQNSIVNSLGMMSLKAQLQWGVESHKQAIAFGFMGMSSGAFSARYAMGWQVFSAGNDFWGFLGLKMQPNVQIACSTAKGCIYNVR